MEDNYSGIFTKKCVGEANKFYPLSHYDDIITNDFTGYDENGDIIFKFHKKAIKNADKYRDILRNRGKQKTNNRGSATGVANLKGFPKKAVKLIHPTTNEELPENHKLVSIKYENENGKISKRCVSNYSRGSAVGYFDNVGKLPCREVGWTKNNPEKQSVLVELAEEVEEAFKKTDKSKYEFQKDMASKSPFTFGDTCFSTMTINYDFRTAAHKDKGDLVNSLSTLTIFEDKPNNYQGFYLGLPEYKVCFDIRDSDTLVFNAHEFHCNTEYKVLSNALPKDDMTGNSFAGRTAVVLYLRNRLHKCPPPYKIAIPSYNRPDIIREKTLKMLENIPKKFIYIFLHNEEQKELYNLDKEYNVVIMNNEPSIKQSRNFMKDYFEEGEKIVFVDDDIECIIDLERKPCNFRKVIEKGFKEIEKRGLKLWGLYPISNNFLMKEQITTDLRYCIGCFCGVILDKEAEERTTEAVEDIERTIKYFKKYNGIVRMNMNAPKTLYFRVKGGITNGDKEKRKEKSKEDSIKLAKMFPEYCKFRERKHGLYDCKLLKIKPKIIS